MATACPVGFDVEGLRKRISTTYERMVREPKGSFHFNRGMDYACALLGYDRQELEALPRDSVDRFAGVGNPHRIAPIEPGQTVLDIGCGAGMDLLLAAQRTGPTGQVIGVDMTPGMRERARAAAEQAGLAGIVEIRPGHAEALPVEDESIDVVISNGVLNLSPDKERAFREIHRILRAGGRLQLADVIVQKELSLDDRNDIELWAG